MPFRLLTGIAIRIALALCLFVSQAQAGSMTLLGVGKVGAAAPSYQGPGDISPSTALAWGSCARVYNAALASTTTSLCDLVDSSTGTTAICTLRGSATGFVDLTGTYCTGSQTPSAACAAATGGSCRVSKVYDQIGGTSGWLQATNANRPTLTFSALNGLPGVTSSSAASSQMATSTTFTQATFTLVSVGKRTASFSNTSDLMGFSSTVRMGFANAANTAAVSDGTTVLSLGSVADSSFHAVQGVMASGSSVISVDGSENSGSAGTTNISGATSRLFRDGGGNELNGIGMEFGIWSGSFGSTDRSNMNSNIHSATNGYNF